MKIESIHVNNFGKLHDTDITFGAGINAICEDNGWGKSTLSAFLRAMFFGLEGDNKRDEISCERKRFAPWQGGAFGGSMIFNTDGHRYLVTRIFHDKAADDEFELRDADTNLISDAYSARLGEELFNINSESFMKTVFIEQNDAKSTGTTGDINAKLGNISDGIDLNRFADADAALKDTINALSPTRKTGYINKLKSKASELRAEIMATQDIDNALNTLDARINTNNMHIDECNAEIDKLNAVRARVSKHERKRSDKAKYEELVAEINKKADDIAMLKAEIGDKLPDKTMLDEWENTLDKVEQNKAVLNANTLSMEEQTIYSDLSARFVDSVPDDGTISSLIEDAGTLTSLNNQSKRYEMNPAEIEKMDRLSLYYAQDEDTITKINSLNHLWTNRTKALADYTNVTLDIREAETQKPQNLTYKLCFIMFSLAGVVTMVGGALGTAFVSPIMCSMAIMGLALLVLSFVFKKKADRIKESQQNSIDELKSQATALDEIIADYDAEVSEFLQAHGRIFDEQQVTTILSELLIEASEYKTLVGRHQEAMAFNHSAECRDYSHRIKEFLMMYNIDVSAEDYQAELVNLRARARHYISLKASVDSRKAAQNNIDTLISNLRASMKEYGIEPGIDIRSRISELYTKLEKIKLSEKVYEDAVNRKNAFEASVDVVSLMAEESSDDSISLEEIELKSQALDDLKETYRNALLTDQRQRDNLLEQYEHRQEQIEELDNLEETIKVKTLEYKRINLTQEFLTKAKESLTSKYMEPLLNGFSKYFKVLTNDDSIRYHIDANTKLTIEAEGKQRDTHTLSSGYQDLTGVCMRLAMADAMYPDEKPVLILDDPFVNLDDNKLDGGRRLLEEVSKEYQVLYFTCSKSRM